jgi:hypothetical protein
MAAALRALSLASTARDDMIDSIGITVGAVSCREFHEFLEEMGGRSCSFVIFVAENLISEEV